VGQNGSAGAEADLLGDVDLHEAPLVDGEANVAEADARQRLGRPDGRDEGRSLFLPPAFPSRSWPLRTMVEPQCYLKRSNRQQPIDEAWLAGAKA
jgi:hypothetical protein